MADFLTYKEKPLVRKGKEIYYGDTTEPYIVKFTILKSEKKDNQEVPSEILIQLIKSDTQLPEKDRIKKESTKTTMYEALDLGFVWLERALKN